MAFNIFKSKKLKKKSRKSNKIPVFLEGSRIFSNSQKAITLANVKKLGERKQGRVIYSSYEVIYLVENKKAEIYHNDKLITLQKFLKIVKRKSLMTDYLVFKDLRKKGYIVKTGLKFGAEFRVYKNNQKHACWIVYPTTPSNKVDWKEFASKNRIAHTTGKKLLIAVVDSQEDVTYYEVGWLKL